MKRDWIKSRVGNQVKNNTYTIYCDLEHLSTRKIVLNQYQMNILQFI